MRPTPVLVVSRAPLGAFYDAGTMSRSAPPGRVGEFYLGGEVIAGTEPAANPLLYDAADLTTHAVIIGMTGSGKTADLAALATPLPAELTIEPLTLALSKSNVVPHLTAIVWLPFVRDAEGSWTGAY